MFAWEMNGERNDGNAQQKSGLKSLLVIGRKQRKNHSKNLHVGWGTEKDPVGELTSLKTFLPHFWARLSHVHVYACHRKAYRLTSHGQGAGRDRKALLSIVDKRHTPE